jgi:hypothetical protein
MDRESVSDLTPFETKRLCERRVAADCQLGIAGNGDVVFTQMALKFFDAVDAAEM